MYAAFFFPQLREKNFAIRQQEKASQQGLIHKISRLVFKLFLGKGERALLFQNILLLLFTILLLLQFLMKPVCKRKKNEEKKEKRMRQEK